jgi:FtsZ-binding cell division protein ZapB
MTKDQLHALIQADRDAREDLLRSLIEADRRAKQDELLGRNPIAPAGDPDGGQWRSLVMLCRLVHETLDQDDEEADEHPGVGFPEPLEAVRRRLINTRRLLKAARADQETITLLQTEITELLAENARLSGEREEAYRIARVRLADLKRIQASDDLDDRHWSETPVEEMTTGQILAMRSELEGQIQQLTGSRLDSPLTRLPS